MSTSVLLTAIPGYYDFLGITIHPELAADFV